jgi:2-dehydropantoate 2-reductase
MAKKRIVFIGGGAVGAYTAAHLVRGGEDVTIFDPWPENVQTINSAGIEVTGTTEQEHFIQAVDTRPLSEIGQLWQQQPIDIAFMCTKSYDTGWATTMVAPYLAPDGFVVSLQNCINEETIADVVGWGRTVGCIASLIAVDLHAPGEVRRNVPLGGENHTVFRVGEPHGRITTRVEHIATLLRNADSAKTTNNLWGERWSKLAANAMRNALAASTGLAGNAGDAFEGHRRFALKLAGETVKVGSAHGNVFETVYGLQPDQLIAAVDGDKAALQGLEDNLLARGIKTGSGHLPSMGQDIRKKRRTEIDYINGFVARKGLEVGIDAPANAAITELVKQVERGEVKQSPEAIDKMVAAVLG